MTLLKPGGMFIGSVPTTPTVDANPHHLHDFTEASFRQLLATHQVQEKASFQQTQSFNPITVLSRKESRLSDFLQKYGPILFRASSSLVATILGNLTISILKPLYNHRMASPALSVIPNTLIVPLPWIA